MTELRRRALARHAELPWPHASDDIWRRTDVSLLDPMQGFSIAPPRLLQSIRLTEHQAEGFTQPLGGEQLVVRLNGEWFIPPSDRSDIKIEELSQFATVEPEAIRRIIESDGLTEAEQKLASLNLAFHNDDLVVRVPDNFIGVVPIRLVRAYSVKPKQAVFPLTVIFVGAGSSLTLIDEYASIESENSTEPHLVHGRIELVLESGSTLNYVRLQRLGSCAREFLLERATLASKATLKMANINLGAALSKAHVITKLIGEHADTKIYGFVFGHGAQHIDQHTLQDHQAPKTSSDLHFRAALKDKSRMIYTGLIRIAKHAKQTSAYQANHDLLLSEEAKADTIPMLEILADDVQCKHAASIGPIDDEQAFYLMSRGIARNLAERLVVMGFIESIVQEIPFEPLQERLRQEIEGSLHG